MKKKVQDKLDICVVPASKKYSVEVQSMAIAFLDSEQRDFKGTLTPHFEKVSKYLDIPATTLQGWWEKRDEIIRMAGVSSVELPKAVALMLSIESLEIVKELKRRGYKDISARDLTNLLATYITKMRLLSGRSTTNASVSIAYTPVFPSSRKPVRIKSDEISTNASEFPGLKADNKTK